MAPVGWYQTREGKFFFEKYASSGIGFRRGGALVPLNDPEPPFIGTHEGFLLGYSSFLEQGSGRQGVSLGGVRGDLGLHLPPSDTAVRILLTAFGSGSRTGKKSESKSMGCRRYATAGKSFRGEGAEIDDRLLRMIEPTRLRVFQPVVRTNGLPQPAPKPAPDDFGKFQNRVST
jgi:hypothetical protein